MINPNNPEPLYLRYIDGDVPASKQSKALRVLIADLPEGGASEVTAQEFAALVARVEALETAGG